MRRTHTFPVLTRAVRVGLVLLWGAVPSAGQAPAASSMPTEPVTLADALTRGMEASHRLAELRARGDAASAVVAQRDAASKPAVSLSGGYTRTNHVTAFGVPQPNGQLQVVFPDIPDNYRSRLDLQWPIFTAGRLDALERAARAEQEATGKDLEAAGADLRLEISRAFWALATAADAARVVGESVKRTGAHLADVRERLAQGLIPPNDVLRVQSEHARQQALLIEAENTREQSRAELARLIGSDPDVPLEIAPDLSDAATPTADLPGLIAQARDQRADRQALADRAQAATERMVAASRAQRPTVAVAGGVDYARPNARILPRRDDWQSSWDLSVNATWVLFDGGRVKAETAEATAVRRALDERLKEVDSQIALEVRQRRLDVASARAALEAIGESVTAAAEARRVIGERYEAGVATTTDVLDAQVAQLQTELDRTRALAGLRLASARLDRALGH